MIGKSGTDLIFVAKNFNISYATKVFMYAFTAEQSSVVKTPDLQNDKIILLGKIDNQCIDP